MFLTLLYEGAQASQLSQASLNKSYFLPSPLRRKRIDKVQMPVIRAVHTHLNFQPGHQVTAVCSCNTIILF